MAIAPFLAMTGAEIQAVPKLPPKIAWMACHFSPYGLGLSNLPRSLPPGSLLMVDDITPPHGHDPDLIAEQLTSCTEKLQCSGILLDFQRQNSPETAALAKHLTKVLPCPVAVSERYAGNLDCPVFLSPVPPSVPLNTHIAHWEGRKIWLEISLEGEILTLTENGCGVTSLSCPDPSSEGFEEESLHCHYQIAVNEKAARFTLWRNQEDLRELLEEAKTLGISAAIGLYQELHGFVGQTF